MKALLLAALGLVMMAPRFLSMHAGPHADGATFSGRVALLAADGITVTEPKSNMSRHFVIVPSEFSVISADGKTTYPMNAVRVGQSVKVEYDQKTPGQQNAVHLWLLDKLSVASNASAGL